MKRVTVKLKTPNPLFEKWLIEWRDEAKDTKMHYCFNLALKSLQQYPLPLQSGRDCKILKGFGSKLCDMLEKKLRNHRSSGTAQDIPTEVVTVSKSPRVKKPNRTVKPGNKDYMPQYRSGGYAILIALYQQSLKCKTSLTKSDIINFARDLSDVSFTKPEPGSRYTAWSSMKTLLGKNLVVKAGNPPKFSLTDEGMIVAKLLEDSHQHDSGILKEIINENTEDSSKTVKNAPAAATQTSIDTLQPGCFEIILYVDTQETVGSSKRQEDELLHILSTSLIKYEVKHLKVGDFLWVCRSRLNPQLELVLPYVVERKRMDDFASSIRDKRYHEQKFRLKKSGLENRIYLVENYGRNQHLGLPLSSLHQAATNTAIQEGFFVKFTDNIKDTVQYLIHFSKTLVGIFKDKTMLSCPIDRLPPLEINSSTINLITFKEFSASSAKNKGVTVSDLFSKMLIQLKGMSVEKALSITQVYPTPLSLMRAYEECNSGENLLTTIKCGKSGKHLGAILSKTVYQAFYKDLY